MIPYSIHVAILLATCLLFYKLLLQKETYYRANRVILLACLALAFVLPLIPVPQQFSFRAGPPVKTTEVSGLDAPVTQQEPLINTVLLPDAAKDLPAAKPKETKASETKITVNQQQVITPVQATPRAVAPVTVKPSKPVIPEIPLWQQAIKWAFWLYWCGVAAFGANLLLQVIVLLYQSYRKPAMLDGQFRIVELDGDKAPHSFGNSIFINPSKYDWETYNQILLHEKVHIQQGHSFDLILAELMLVVQWFNPFAWIYRKELESNLEFLTDDSVLHHHKVEPGAYQMSLLKVSVPNFSMSIATNYNQSLLKKRIVMMNAKRSNIHTMWKYFMLMPLLVALVCGLNKPIAVSSPLAKFQQVFTSIRSHSDIDFSHGSWYATLKGERMSIQFQADDNDDNNNWTSTSTFKTSDFPNLPKNEKADFTLTREAGSIVFNGKFDGDQGIGHYKFTPNAAYKDFIAKQNIEDMDDDTYFSFFISDVKKEYVQFLKANGFKDVTRGQIMSMSRLKIDASYIRYWKKMGYNELSANDLISLKAQKVDSTYVADIRRAGYTDLTARELISFKAQHITGDYINSLKKATLKPGVPEAETKPTAREIMSSKSMHIDSAYVAGIRSSGYSFENYNQLSSLKSMNITPEYIKSFEAVGLTGLTPNQLYNFKAQNVTPEYAKEFKDLGYSEADVARLVTMKRQGITPEYLKSFAAVGYKNIPVNSLYGLTNGKVTPNDIKGYQAVGYGVATNVDNTGSISTTLTGQAPAAVYSTGSTNLYSGDAFASRGSGTSLTLNTVSSFKTEGITPEYIKGFQDLGYKDVPFSTFRSLKSQGITPEFIKGFQDIGYKDIPLNSFYSYKSVTPEFIKSFQDAGYKNATISQYASLKRDGITPEFAQGFKKLGFTELTINELSYLKRSGVTPEFVTEMKQKGFESKDINKYIQLKNFNSTSNNTGSYSIGGLGSTIIYSGGKPDTIRISGQQRSTAPARSSRPSSGTNNQ